MNGPYSETSDSKVNVKYKEMSIETMQEEYATK